MHTTLSFFIKPVIVALLAFIVIWYQAGTEALFLVIILSILEITLSFDNAVVNAKVLERMTPVWRKRFLTWGILVAVFGTRLVLPALIVSVATFTSPLYIATLAVTNPTAYGELLQTVGGAITAFGGTFLLMVSLKYFFDQEKSIHWISVIERHFARWGRVAAIEIAIALVVLLLITTVSHEDAATILSAGLVGLILFIIMEGIGSSFSPTTGAVAKQGLSLFIYINILDSAFSLDGVVGAFALSSNLLIIVTGLGIGAYFVRALTLYMVAQQTLTKLAFLEHGAHWAIFGLAAAMFADLIIDVPELITGLIGLLFISLSYYTSRIATE